MAARAQSVDPEVNPEFNADFTVRAARTRRDVRSGDLFVLLLGPGNDPDWGDLSASLSDEERVAIVDAGERVAAGEDLRVERPAARRSAPSSMTIRRLDALPNDWATGQHPVHRWIRASIGAAERRGVQRLSLIVLSAPGRGKSESGDSAKLEFEVDELTLASLVGAARYRFATFRGKASADADSPKKIEQRRPDHLDVLWWTGKSLSPAKSRAFSTRADALAGAAHVCRSLGNTPPNVATPEWMATRTRDLAGPRALRCEVWSPPQLLRRRLAGTAAVGRGSSNEPRFVRLRSKSDTRRGTRPKLTLIGKGVTFDSGGISIKPSASMEEMKFDKCGACTALALGLLVRDLDLKVDLELLLPFAENLPDARATRPADILEFADGTTVEVINTDAEGRLLLADAFLLSASRKPDLVLEFSTLTGAAVVAVGERAAAFYTPDDALAREIDEAGGLAGERFWRMPLWAEDAERMKGQHADLRNSSDRWGSANTAAAFLGHFARDLPLWAHIDLAGPAYSSKKDLQSEPGATAFGVRTGLLLIERWLAGHD